MIDLPRLRRGLRGRYVLIRELGRGATASVFEAKDERHDRTVALKILRSEIAVAVGTARFMREITVTASLSHPHILPLYDSGEVEGQLYYVMPLVHGESLRVRLERERRVPLDEAIRIAGAVADALGYAHERGLVHRDVKPENILLESGTGRVLVADFGIAVPLALDQASRLTPGGFIVGTPAYMSPEQASGDPALDGRSDLYALACVFYEMVAGEPPFVAANAQALIARRFMGLAETFGLRSGFPASVRAAVRRALAVAPDERFGSVREFAGALTEAVATTGT